MSETATAAPAKAKAKPKNGSKLLTARERLCKIADEIHIGKKIQKKGVDFPVRSADDVAEAVRPLCAKHGITIEHTMLRDTERWETEEVTVMSYGKEKTFTLHRMYVWFSTKFVNASDDQDFVEVQGLGIGWDKAFGIDKIPGKANTYAWKMACVRMFHIGSGDDPDMEAHEEQPINSKPAAKANGGYTTTAPKGSPKTDGSRDLYAKEFAEEIKDAGLTPEIVGSFYEIPLDKTTTLDELKYLRGKLERDLRDGIGPGQTEPETESTEG